MLAKRCPACVGLVVARHARFCRQARDPTGHHKKPIVGHDKPDTGHCHLKQQPAPGIACPLHAELRGSNPRRDNAAITLKAQDDPAKSLMEVKNYAATRYFPCHGLWGEGETIFFFADPQMRAKAAA